MLMMPTVASRSKKTDSVVPDTLRMSRGGLDRRTVRVLLYLALMVTDIIAIALGFGLGALLKGSYWMSLGYANIGWIVAPLHVIIALKIGAYSRSAVTSRLDSFRLASYGFLAAVGLTMLLIFFMKEGDDLSRIGVGSALLAAICLIGLFRFTLLSFFPRNVPGWLTGELLIVDGAPVPDKYEGDVLDVRAAGIEPDIQSPHHLSMLAEYVIRYDRVIVRAPASRRSDWAQVLKCFDTGGEVMLDDGNPLGAIAVDKFSGKDTLVISRGSLSLESRFMKRFMDVALSGVAVVVFSPLLLVTALAIKLDSRGPVFFAQPRVGRGNRMFKILKFRSMRVETADFAGNRSASRDDDRITRVGKFIRATSIDELPQILNVLKGDMSIVGPRPHALGSLAGDKLFWQVDDAYWRRHTLRPGITGLAQVRGFRGATHHQSDLENRLQSDLEYVNGWSLWRDIKIVFATFKVIVHPEAY